MAGMVFQLASGLDLGGVAQRECEIREATAGDVINASEESEKVVMTADGPELVTSPTLAGVNALRRQIVRIGEIQGPLERDLLDKLSADDLELIRKNTSEIEQAARSVSQLGRQDQPGEGSAQSH